jgi:NAD+ synthase
MEAVDQYLKINPEEIRSKIIQFINYQLEEQKRDGVLVPFDGSIESVVLTLLCKDCIGVKPLKLLLIHEKLSEEIIEPKISTIKSFIGLKEDSIIKTDIEETKKAITRGIQKPLPTTMSMIKKSEFNYNLGYFLMKDLFQKEIDMKTYEPPQAPQTKPSRREKFLTEVIAHHKLDIRLKVLYAFLFAENENLMVIGEINKTEWLTGLFTKFGPSVAVDLLPFKDLYRSQVLQLASYLKVPQEIIDLEAELLSGTKTKYEYLFDIKGYDVDRVLVRLEKNQSPETITKETGISKEIVDKIHFFFKGSSFQRSAPLYPQFNSP